MLPHGSMSAMATKSSNFKGNSSSNYSGDKGKNTWNNNGPKPSSWNNNGKFSQGESSSGEGYKSFNSIECQICGKRGRNATNCYQNSECQICHKKGHIASKCFQNPSNNQNAEYRSNTSASPECQICSKKGHIPINYFYRSDIPANHPSLSVVVCQICGLKGHVALNCHHRSNYAYQGAKPPASLTAMTAQSVHNGARSSNSQNHNNTEVWIGDFGATHHMTSDLRNMSIAYPFESNNTITISNGEGLHVKHIGAAKITPASQTFQLNNVLHVPSLAVNLLSLNKVCKDNHCYIAMDDVDICVQDKESKALLYRGNSNGELKVSSCSKLQSFYLHVIPFLLPMLLETLH